ncbi:exonuclease [Staphylococcus phage PG-2021_40]
MVKFIKVEIQNFMSIKKATLELEDRGLVLIEGENNSNESYISNGAGKTTSISAITYALYGKTEKGLKSDEVVNNVAKKDTYVKLNFMIGNDEYFIERYRKHKQHKNKVILIENGNDITGSTSDVTDKKIQELFKIDFNTYVNAIVYGQGDMPMFSQATDKGKKEILESITGVQVYKLAHERAKEKVKEVEQQQSELHNKIQFKDNEIHFIMQQYEKEKVNYQNLQDTIAQKEQQYKQEKEISDRNKSNLNSDIAKLKAQKLDISYTEYQYPDNYYSHKENLEKLNSALSTLNVQVSTLENQNRQLHTQRGKLDTSDKCPVCGSEIDNSHKLKEQETIQKQIQDNEKTINDLKQKITKVVDTQEQIKNYVETIDKDREVYDNGFRQKTQHNNYIDEQVRNLENSLAQGDSNLVSLKSSIDTLKQTQEPILDNDSLSKLNTDKDEINKDIVNLETKKSNYEDAMKAFSNKGIRSVVLDFVTPFLNKQANKYLQMLSGSDIELEFKTQVKDSKGELKDKFDIIITNKNGGGTYKANSAGEQKRIDLAISFAIQDLLLEKNDMSTNIALYDECFDGLDVIGCENVITLLKDRLNTVGTIFVITHNQDLKPLFEKTIKVVKDNGVSTIIGGNEIENTSN